MFGPAGSLYVFLSYGLHRLLNIVCDREGIGSAVLIRSYEPVIRGTQPALGAVACGPGRVGSALGIGLDMSGLPMGPASEVFVLDDGEPTEVGRTTRIGISQGRELLLRYYSVGSRHVSGAARSIGGGGQ